MALVSYLTRFRSSLPQTQGKHLLKILQSERSSGKIKTVDEFKQRLQALTGDLLEAEIKPTFKLYSAGTGDISSEQFNDMLEKAQNDLSTAFTEANTIEEVIQAHQNVVFNVALKSLRLAANQLEEKIRLYEFIRGSNEGFDDAIFNTFRSSTNQGTARTADAASVLYVDPKKSESIDSSQDALIDEAGERLTLGAAQTTYSRAIKAEWSSGANSPQSELDVSIPNSRIENIIDGKKGTYWQRSVLLSKIATAGVSHEIKITFGAAEDINFIEIDPIGISPITISSIEYIDAGNNRLDSGLSSFTIETSSRILVPRINAISLILTVLQDSYQESQFLIRKGQDLAAKVAAGLQKKDPDISEISTDLQKTLTSDFIKNDILSISTETEPVGKYFEYKIGFDNIRSGLHTFDERSIFVSKKKTVNQLGLIGLKAQEFRPVRISGSTDFTLVSHAYPARDAAEDANSYHSSVEYWVGVQYFDSRNFLISTDIYPILPFGAARIYQERLLLTYKSAGTLLRNDIGSLTFYTEDDENDVKIYRNAELLNYGTDWEFVSVGDTSEATNETPGNGSRMKRGIKVLFAPKGLDVFTASYTPVFSSSLNIPSNSSLIGVTDLVGDQSVRLGPNATIVIDPSRKSFEISKADVYLIILMRRNLANPYLTPAIEEFMLLTSSYNETKFVSDIL